MFKSLEYSQKVKINQTKTAKIVAKIDRLQGLLIVLPASPGSKIINDLPYADVINKRLYRHDKPSNNAIGLTTELPNTLGTHCIVTLVDDSISSFDLLTLARKMATSSLDHKAKTIGIQTLGLDETLATRMVEALTTALLSASCPLPHFKNKGEQPEPIQRIEISANTQGLNLKRLRAEVEGNHLTRWLSILPPNKLTPKIYRQLISKMAKQQGWQMEFLDQDKLKQRKAGAFLAVAQGSNERDAGIVHLRYRPTRMSKSSKPIALVGKGICFDTGGVNLKPARYMLGMHEDMQGSAVALGSLLALTRSGFNQPVDCWLALAQNHIGPAAYKPNDVVHASNGTSIEIIHTDAEGRMVLADTLALASKQKPRLIIDYATLTGTCMQALGSNYSGLFSNRESLYPDLIKNGKNCGERVWPFPMDKDYDSALDSKVADIKQCTLDGDADHILAARFLNRFIAHDTPWIHIDLSASNHKGGLAHIPSDTTGFGVRYTLHLLYNKEIKLI
ncbi:MAG: leucyl aminopeptidase family protein [Gammaproteobacteria bacterium]|nr:leucyl aminopeptidase family protein [Gammaproteobacteria bacterium]